MRRCSRFSPKSAMQKFSEPLPDFLLQAYKPYGFVGSSFCRSKYIERSNFPPSVLHPLNSSEGGVAVVDMRVLVVDDNRAHAEGLAELLSIRGCAAWHVPDAETALADLGGLYVDAILSDVQLPGMSGYELCRRIRAMRRFDRTAFIFHTASNEISGTQHGGDAFLTYPVDIDHLITVVVGCLARRRGQKTLDTMDLWHAIKGNADVQA